MFFSAVVWMFDSFDCRNYFYLGNFAKLYDVCSQSSLKDVLKTLEFERVLECMQSPDLHTIRGELSTEPGEWLLYFLVLEIGQAVVTSPETRQRQSFVFFLRFL